MVFVDWNTGNARLIESGAGKVDIKFLAVGDVMLIDNVEKQIKKFSPGFPFEKVLSLFNRQDYIFCNLEAMLRNKKNKRLAHKRATFEIDPESLDGLLNAGINIINVGNNHSVDFGYHQVVETMTFIRNKNGHAIGGGANKAEARKPVIVEKKGVKIGFLGYAKKDQDLNAGDDRPGNTGFVLEEVIEDVCSLRENVNVLIVSVHWGWEFVNYPDPEIQRCFRRIIDAGSDVILGHHPHFINGVELYKGKPIFYSLGSFLVDYEPPLSEYELNLFRSSFNNNIAVQFYISEEGLTGFEIIPVRMTPERQAMIESETERSITLDLMKHYSEALQNDQLDRIFWKNSKNHLMIQFPAFKLWIRENGFHALEWILQWLSKPVSLKMLSGNFLRLNPPDFMIVILGKMMLVLYKAVNMINRLRPEKFKKQIDVFDPQIQDNN